MGGGGGVNIHSARRISFEMSCYRIDFKKEFSWAEHRCINIRLLESKNILDTL